MAKEAMRDDCDDLRNNGAMIEVGHESVRLLHQATRTQTPENSPANPVPPHLNPIDNPNNTDDTRSISYRIAYAKSRCS